MRKIYLDNAATTPIHEEVIDEMADCMKKTFGNPSSTHVFGREAKAKMELSRKKSQKLYKYHLLKSSLLPVEPNPII